MRMLKIFNAAIHYWDYKEKRKLNFITSRVIPFRFVIQEV
jgi:hypothetical protein